MIAVMRTDHDPEEQPPAERHAEQTGDGDRGQAGYDEYVPSEDAGAESGGHQRESVALDVRRGRACHWRGQHHLHVDVNRREDRGMQQ